MPLTSGPSAKDRAPQRRSTSRAAFCTLVTHRGARPVAKPWQAADRHPVLETAGRRAGGRKRGGGRCRYRLGRSRQSRTWWCCREYSGGVRQARPGRRSAALRPIRPWGRRPRSTVLDVASDRGCNRALESPPRALHDYVAGTVVAYVRAPQPSSRARCRARRALLWGNGIVTQWLPRLRRSSCGRCGGERHAGRQATARSASSSSHDCGGGRRRIWAALTRGSGSPAAMARAGHRGGAAVLAARPFVA